MNLEDDLRRALEREQAPADFAARVLARATPATPRVLPFWQRPMSLALAAMLAFAALVPPAIYEYQKRRRAMEARDQLVLALSITRVQLQQVKERIRQNTRHK
jgi:hypothetical protein